MLDRIKQLELNKWLRPSGTSSLMVQGLSALWSDLSSRIRSIVYLCSCFIVFFLVCPAYAQGQYCAQPDENLTYESIASHSVTQCGDQVTIQVIVQGTFNGDNHYVKIYVDNDQDGITYETEYDLGVVVFNGSNSTFSLTTSTINNPGTINYRIIMTYNATPTGPCNDLPTTLDYGDITDDSFVNSLNGPFANPSNATVCQGDNVNVGSATTGGTPGYTYLWSITGGTSTGATLTNTTNSTVTLNSSSATVGSVDLTLTVTDAASCSQSEVALVSIQDPVLVAAGTDVTFCADGDASLNGSISGSINIGSWSGGGGTFNPNAQTLNATYTPTPTEIANGQVTLTLTSDEPAGACTASSDQVDLTITPIQTADAGTDDSICSGDDIQLNGSVGGSATSGTWSGGAGVFNPSNTVLNATYTPTAGEISSGSIVLTLTTDGLSGCGSDTDDVSITIVDPVVVNAGPDQTICADATSITLNGSITSPVAAGTWSGGAGVFAPDATTLNTTYTPTAAELSSGLISLVLTSDAAVGPCGTEFDVVLITVEQLPTVDAGIDIMTCGSGGVALNGSVAGSPTTVIWSGGAGTYSPDANTLTATYAPTAAEVSAGSLTLTLTAIPAGVCSNSVSDDVTIIIEEGPTVNASLINVDCITSEVQLDGSIGGSATSATWTGGAGSFSPNASTLNAIYTPTSAEVSNGSVTLALTTDTPAGNCLPASEVVNVPLGNLVAASLSANTVCASHDLVIPGNPSGGTGVYTSHVWTVESGSTATGISLMNASTSDVTLNADGEGSVNLSYTVTDSNGCSATETTIINVRFSPSCQIAGPDVTCNSEELTLKFVPLEFDITPSSGTVVTGSQGAISTHVFDGVTSPDEVRVVLTLPTWDDSFYEATLNGNVLYPASDEPQSWGAGGLNLNAPWEANVNGLPRTRITLTSTSITYEVSQNTNSTVMTTVVPTNWTPTPQPFQIGSNTIVFGIKNTAGPTSGSWFIEAFQDLTQTYLWSDGSTTDSINVTPTATTTYSVTVSNSTGCSRVCSHTVIVEDLAIAGDDQSICNGGSTTIGAAPVTDVTYSWTPAGSLSSSTIANPIASPTTTTEYILTATSLSGCIDTDTIVVTVEDPTSGATDQFLCVGQIHAVDGLPMGGSGSFTNHQWTELSNTATGYLLSDLDKQVLSFNASNAGTGTVTMRYTADVVGCVSIVKDIVITLGPLVNFSGPGSICEDEGLQVLSATPSGGVFSGTGITGASFDPVVAGAGTHIITYTYTDANSCTVTKNDAITVTALPCTTQSCTVVTSDNFDINWGPWNDGGVDAARTTQFPNSSTHSIRLRDNSGAASSMFTDPLDMTLYDEAIVDFSYYVRSFDNPTEDFFLEISLDNGASYTIVEEWNLNDEFVNNQRYNESVTVSGITFTTTTRFRFRSDASANGDQVYIDDVVIQGCEITPPEVCTLVSYVGGLSTSGKEDELGLLTIDLEIPAPLATDLNVTYYTLDGTANTGSDYTGIASGTATIIAGNTSTSQGGVPLQVNISPDSDLESDEDFQFVISSDSGVCANPDSILTVTIENDDNSAPILTNEEIDNMLYCPSSGSSTIVTNTIVVSEPEGQNLTAVVTLTGTTDPAADILSVDLSSYPAATATYSYPTLTITGTIPPVDMQNILRSIEFMTDSNVMGVRSIQIVVNDGTQDSNISTRNINSNEDDAACCNASAPSLGK